VLSVNPELTMDIASPDWTAAQTMFWILIRDLGEVRRIPPHRRMESIRRQMVELRNAAANSDGRGENDALRPEINRIKSQLVGLSDLPAIEGSELERLARELSPTCDRAASSAAAELRAVADANERTNAEWRSAWDSLHAALISGSIKASGKENGGARLTIERLTWHDHRLFLAHDRVCAAQFIDDRPHPEALSRIELIMAGHGLPNGEPVVWLDILFPAAEIISVWSAPPVGEDERAEENPDLDAFVAQYIADQKAEGRIPTQTGFVANVRNSGFKVDRQRLRSTFNDQRRNAGESVTPGRPRKLAKEFATK
jgi:hypothetical protein